MLLTRKLSLGNSLKKVHYKCHPFLPPPPPPPFWICSTWIWSVRLRQEVAFWFQCWKNGKTHVVLFDQSNKTGAIDVKMYRSFLEKLSFKMLGLTFSSILDWGSYIISIAKTASKIAGALVGSVKFISPEVALYLYKSTIWLCMQYC